MTLSSESLRVIKTDRDAVSLASYELKKMHWTKSIVESDGSKTLQEYACSQTSTRKGESQER